MLLNSCTLNLGYAPGAEDVDELSIWSQIKKKKA